MRGNQIITQLADYIADLKTRERSPGNLQQYKRDILAFSIIWEKSLSPRILLSGIRISCKANTSRPASMRS